MAAAWSGGVGGSLPAETVNPQGRHNPIEMLAEAGDREEGGPQGEAFGRQMRTGLGD